VPFNAGCEVRRKWLQRPPPGTIPACGPSALTPALPIVQFQQFLCHHVNLKLGIVVHSGPVVAGVIGEQKFSYDLWDNTANVASKMASEDIPDKIQISLETREIPSDRFRIFCIEKSVLTDIDPGWPTYLSPTYNDCEYMFPPGTHASPARHIRCQP